MAQSKVLVLVAVASAGVTAFGCSAAPVDDALAAEALVDVETDGLEARDDGTSWNGWTQGVGGGYNPQAGGETAVFEWGFQMTRAWGDTTRGGGGCVVLKRSSSSCTVDSHCTAAAQTEFGSDAYGYCWDSKCYDRPGAQSDFCTVGPNRSPGAYFMDPGYLFVTIPSGYASNPYFLGCMTKTAGPNYACGGTNSSLYMRTVISAVYDPSWSLE